LQWRIKSTFLAAATWQVLRVRKQWDKPTDVMCVCVSIFISHICLSLCVCVLFGLFCLFLVLFLVIIYLHASYVCAHVFF
jgi:hypothetical protein